MTPLALAIGFLAVAIGIVGIAAPHGLQAIFQHSITPIGLGVAAAVRVAVGVVLVRAAPASRAPRVLRIVGILAVVAGLITLLLGVDRARAIFDWWSNQGPVLIRLWAVLALFFGAFITYAVIPRRRAACGP